MAKIRVESIGNNILVTQDNKSGDFYEKDRVKWRALDNSVALLYYKETSGGVFIYTEELREPVENYESPKSSSVFDLLLELNSITDPTAIDQSKANVAYSQYEQSFPASAEMDSGWIDMGGSDKVQFSGFASVSGMTVTTLSKATEESPTQLSTPVQYNDGTFYMFNIICRQRWMRFKWSNTTGGAVTDASMEIKQFFGASDKLSVFPVSVAPSDFSQAALVQSIVRGQDSGGTYRNISLNQGGATLSSNYLKEVALGNVSGYSIDTMFGGVSALDTADGDNTIWRIANDTYTNRVSRKTFQTSASTLYIASTSAADTNIEITVTYNDSNNDEQTTTVELNGQTAVSLGVSGIDCNRMYVSSENDTLAGNVTLINANNFSAGGVPNDVAEILAFIIAGAQQAEQACYRVPRNKKMLITRLYSSITRSNGSLGSANIELYIKPDGGSWRRYRLYPIDTGSVVNLEEIQWSFDEGTILEWVIDGISDGDTNCNLEFDYLLIDN